MIRDQRCPKAMGGVIIQSLESLRSKEATPPVLATEAADRLEYLHRSGRVRIPDFADHSKARAV